MTTGWRRAREFAVPPSMIETATARRALGDWAGACAAARVDADLDLRATRDTFGHEVAARLRDDLRHLAPDLLRWHLPRVGPDGLLRPGLTVPLARYPGGPHLVARTPPGWAEAGQRISLTLWPGKLNGRRFRLDLHRHLWDARRAPELRDRPGGREHWAAEAAILRRADGDGPILVRLGSRRRLLLDHRGVTETRGVAGLPVLPDAATWPAPDVDLLRAGLIDPGDLHPLVAAALAPGAHRKERVQTGHREVDCNGARHRIGLRDGRLVPFDHGSAELEREELLVELGGPPLPCLRAIDEAIRHPENLDDVRGRLDHGDAAGAIAAVEALLGPGVALRDGPLRDELEAAARRRIDHGLFRNGLAGWCPPPKPDEARSKVRHHPRHATPVGKPAPSGKQR